MIGNAGNVRDDLVVSCGPGNWSQEWNRSLASDSHPLYGTLSRVWAVTTGSLVSANNEYIEVSSSGGTATIESPFYPNVPTGDVYVKVEISKSISSSNLYFDFGVSFAEAGATIPVPINPVYPAGGYAIETTSPNYSVFFFKVTLPASDGYGYGHMRLVVYVTNSLYYSDSLNFNIKLKTCVISKSNNVTGGTTVLSTQDGYAVHIFNTAGTQTLTINEKPQIGNFEYLVVGGGGGGGGGGFSAAGRHLGGGGGGGGGIETGTNLDMSIGAHSVVVGDKGLGGTAPNQGNSGGTSSLGSYVSVAGGGGGGGGSYQGSYDYSGGLSGGSGGGAGGAQYKVGTGGTGTSGEGNDGGSTASVTGGASGGSKGQAGTNALSEHGGAMPVGYTPTIFDLDEIGFGGGGGAGNPGTGFGEGGYSGGGGSGGSNSVGSNAYATGSGGGGGSGSGKNGGNGKSGIVVVKYKLS